MTLSTRLTKKKTLALNKLKINKKPVLSLQQKPNLKFKKIQKYLTQKLLTNSSMARDLSTVIVLMNRPKMNRCLIS